MGFQVLLAVLDSLLNILARAEGPSLDTVVQSSFLQLGTQIHVRLTVVGVVLQLEEFAYSV